MTIEDLLRAAHAHLADGRLADAERSLRAVLDAAPHEPSAAMSLAALLVRTQRAREAADLLHATAGAHPNRPDVWFMLGATQAAAGLVHQAVESLTRTIALAPSMPHPYAVLGTIYLGAGDPLAAEPCLTKALELDPRHLEAYQNLASALQMTWRMEEAAGVIRRGIEAHPGNPELLRAAAVILTYAADTDPREIAALMVARARQLEARFPPHAGPWPNDPDPDRRLRLGYLCQDLQRDSAVARFVAPGILNLDRERFDLVGYLTQPTRERMNRRLLDAMPWVDVWNVDDEALLARIRADRVDILIETAGSTPGHRAAVVARRAAPVQVSYIGDPRTTGLSAVDWRIVDAVTDPPGSEPFCTERLARLPGCFLCYDPHEHAPPPRPPIVDLDPSWLGPEAGITFGYFSTPDKCSAGTLDAWARILRELPGSRLMLKGAGYVHQAVRERFLAALKDRGVEGHRVAMHPATPAMHDHLAHYWRVDIALDSFPCTSTATTCDALWMGVPVVTLRGRWHAARVGASLLTAVGLPDLIADSVDDYVRIAVQLARDRVRLARLHRELRDRMAASPLGDARAHAGALGDALRRMWHDWCRTRQIPPDTPSSSRNGREPA